MAQQVMSEGHCKLQLEFCGSVSPPVGPGQNPGGTSGEAPRSSEILYSTLAEIVKSSF